MTYPAEAKDLGTRVDTNPIGAVVLHDEVIVKYFTATAYCQICPTGSSRILQSTGTGKRGTWGVSLEHRCSEGHIVWLPKIYPCLEYTVKEIRP